MRINGISYCVLLMLAFIHFGCKKNFLDEKPNNNIVTPRTIDELEGLLENTEIINLSMPALSHMASDEYHFIDYAGWQSTGTITERNSYIWAKDLFGGERNIKDWNGPYAAIFYCNNVLEGLTGINTEDQNTERWREIFGRALFIRAYMFYELVRNFSPAYDNATASSDLGVPLKLSARIDEITPRASVEQTYGQITADLSAAAGSLKAMVAGTSRNRPNKVAVMALFARVYLSMRNYDKAEVYADSALSMYNKLIDYNTVDLSAEIPFDLNNDETLFSASVVPVYTLALTHFANSAIVPDTGLVKLYENDDLRRNVFFGVNTENRNLFVKRSYQGFWAFAFEGLATDEVYLIKSECAARRNNIPAAMQYLNDLLIKRYKTGEFVPVNVASKQEAIDKVLLERRKELVWRSLRWSDLKRLNKEGANIELKRLLNGVTYKLSPNDPRYVFPIPDDEITLSGIQQNSR